MVVSSEALNSAAERYEILCTGVHGEEMASPGNSEQNECKNVGGMLLGG